MKVSSPSRRKSRNSVPFSQLIEKRGVEIKDIFTSKDSRLVASFPGIPVGMKNPTSDDISVTMNSITAAQHKHAFLYRDWEVHSDDNPCAHAIFKGYVNKHGQSMPNYHYEDLLNLAQTYANSGLKNSEVIIDTSHANSCKKHLEQIRITKEVLYSRNHDTDIKILSGAL